MKQAPPRKISTTPKISTKREKGTLSPRPMVSYLRQVLSGMLDITDSAFSNKSKTGRPRMPYGWEEEQHIAPHCYCPKIQCFFVKSGSLLAVVHSSGEKENFSIFLINFNFWQLHCGILARVCCFLCSLQFLLLDGSGHIISPRTILIAATVFCAHRDIYPTDPPLILWISFLAINWLC